MPNECRHILTSGHKCKAAALRGQAYCYYHTPARRSAASRFTRKEPLKFPSLKDTAGVQSGLNQVLRSLATRRIDPRHAGLYLHGLQLAARLARKSEDKPEGQE
jgi:hypothetical protein